MNRFVGLAAAGTLVAGIGVWAQQNPRTQSTVPDGDWRTINRDLAANRYSPLKDINTSNVASLKEAWTFRLGGGASSVPLVVGGVMYVSSGGRVVALDGETGKEIWAHSLQPDAAPAPAPPPSDAQGAAAPGGGGGGAAVADRKDQRPRSAASAIGRATARWRPAFCS